MDDTLPFKICTKCGNLWDSQSDFLDDPDVVFVGYQPHFEDARLAFFLFNHLRCGTTLNVRISSFHLPEIEPLLRNIEFTAEVEG
ncbi:MAG TPA: hypothetical protein VKA68_05150 [bacterium]|nr:hypothetical protein [bacterium]